MMREQAVILCKGPERIGEVEFAMLSDASEAAGCDRPDDEDRPPGAKQAAEEVPVQGSARLPMRPVGFAEEPQVSWARTGLPGQDADWFTPLIQIRSARGRPVGVTSGLATTRPELRLSLASHYLISSVLEK